MEKKATTYLAIATGVLAIATVIAALLNVFGSESPDSSTTMNGDCNQKVQSVESSEINIQCSSK